MSERTEQHGITAGGDVAGGDIDKSLNIFNQGLGRSPLATLIARYAEEVRFGFQGSEIIEKLQHWSTPESSEVLGVRDKLERGNRPELVKFGLEAKELFTKCLARHQHSKFAQEMFAYLLGWMWQRFNATIRPRIVEGQSAEKIDSLIQIEIINPMEQMLDSNPLGIDPSELSGMMYFLTGNCHLNWH